MVVTDSGGIQGETTYLGIPCITVRKNTERPVTVEIGTNTLVGGHASAQGDELPELFNVLKGDMSIVGPRPLLMQYLDRYSPEQARRHEVRPGITGWAQVNGRNAINWEEKFKLDVWYVDHQSLRLDLKIIALPFLKVMKREGISQAGQATMQEFMGSLEVLPDSRFPG